MATIQHQLHAAEAASSPWACQPAAVVTGVCVCGGGGGRGGASAEAEPRVCPRPPGAWPDLRLARAGRRCARGRGRCGSCRGHGLLVVVVLRVGGWRRSGGVRERVPPRGCQAGGCAAHTAALKWWLVATGQAHTQTQDATGAGMLERPSGYMVGGTGKGQKATPADTFTLAATTTCLYPPSRRPSLPPEKTSPPPPAHTFLPFITSPSPPTHNARPPAAHVVFVVLLVAVHARHALGARPLVLGRRGAGSAHEVVAVARAGPIRVVQLAAAAVVVAAGQVVPVAGLLGTRVCVRVDVGGRRARARGACVPLMACLRVRV